MGTTSPPQNILARIKGQGPSGKKALMLCAHYDSVDEGPGRSDNAAGVAVVLETLRALKAGPPLERDVIVLFTDGEESGLLGARLFVNEHPWAREIGLALNFDARGNSGPSIMFETSDANGWLISQYAEAVQQPLATSLSMDVYKIMPNDSDMTVFKNGGNGRPQFRLRRPGSPTIIPPKIHRKTSTSAPCSIMAKTRLPQPVISAVSTSTSRDKMT